MDVLESVRKIMLAGVGALALTEEKLESFVQELIKKGELTQEEGKKTLKELREKMAQNKRELEEYVQRKIENSVKKMHLATKKDVEELEKRVSDLEASLEVEKEDS
jgi:poly(hydroxyalkanoate) granule-associated protein